MREYKNNFKSSTDADRGSHSTIFLDCFSESHSIYHTFKYNFANAYCVPGQHPPKCLLVNYTLFCALTLLHSITIKAITYIKLPEQLSKVELQQQRSGQYLFGHWIKHVSGLVFPMVPTVVLSADTKDNFPQITAYSYMVCKIKLIRIFQTYICLKEHFYHLKAT